LAFNVAGGAHDSTVEERLVEQAFSYLRELSLLPKERDGL
jgi:hypothetical protein